MRYLEADITGRIWLLGDDINTDQIIQGKYLTLLDYAEMAKHTLEIPRPEFVKEVRPCDIIVAGRNFGSGSSREEAPMVFVELGVGCVIAESFARIFYRNSFNVGLPLMIVPDICKNVNDGQRASVNLMMGQLTLEDSGRVLEGQGLSGIVVDILRAGGAIPWYKQRFA
jgi:3-isopropylmalate/(R)-2-methylmalate dehydratase small subunit